MSSLTLTEERTDPAGAIRRETLLVAWVALAIALVALAYCVRHGTLLLYGDAVAHLHIARRVFDSLNPGFRQLGSVWLPLPHILLLPFVWNMEWWRSGLAGACLSIPSYVLGCAGIYRLARMWLGVPASVVVAAFYGLNPGLLYMATTAMSEPLFLAEMIWAALLIVQYQQALVTETPTGLTTEPAEASGHAPAGRLLVRAGMVLVGAIFTRYDGWVYAAVAWLFATWPLITGSLVTGSLMTGSRHFGRGLRSVGSGWLLFTAMLVGAPSLWLAYNAMQFGDPLDFMRGPYSARAIEAKTTPPGSPHHPGFHSLPVSAHYFLKAAELGAAPLRQGNLLVWLCFAGTLVALWVFRRRQIWPALLLWLPLPFYAYSVAYGSVPIFIPIWWPFSWYNTRYGMELLPAFAVFAGCLLTILSSRPRLQEYAAWASLLLVVANSVVLLRARPLVYAEAVVNSRTRLPFERTLANALRAMPGEGLILMYVSSDVGAVQQAGIPLRRVVNEGDYLKWQRALEDPARGAAMVVALDGDLVAQAVQRHPGGLRLINVICSTGNPCARIYRSEVAGR